MSKSFVGARPSMKMMMQVGRRTLKRWCVLLGVTATIGCAPAWQGHWRGVADLGPIEAHQLALTLHKDASASVAVRTSPTGEITRYQVCSLQPGYRTLIITMVALPKRCSEGPRWTLKTTVGARVLYGDMGGAPKTSGFFRLWPSYTSAARPAEGG